MTELSDYQRLVVRPMGRERDEAVAFIRVLGEECVLAGLPAGDRTVILANVRALIAAWEERERLRKALERARIDLDACRTIEEHRHRGVTKAYGLRQTIEIIDAALTPAPQEDAPDA